MSEEKKMEASVKKVAASIQYLINGIQSNIGLFANGFNKTLENLSNEIAIREAKIKSLEQEVERLKKELQTVHLPKEGEH